MMQQNGHCKELCTVFCSVCVCVCMSKCSYLLFAFRSPLTFYCRLKIKNKSLIILSRETLNYKIIKVWQQFSWLCMCVLSSNYQSWEKVVLLWSFTAKAIWLAERRLKLRRLVFGLLLFNSKCKVPFSLPKSSLWMADPFWVHTYTVSVLTI